MAATRRTLRRQLHAGAALIVGVVIAAGAVSISAAFTTPSAVGATRTVDGPVTVALADGFVSTGNGTRRITIPAAPGDLTRMHIVFDCVSPGLFTWGIGAGTPSALGCSAADVAGGRIRAEADLPVGDQTRILSIAAAESSRWTVVARFVGDRRSPGGINVNGQTYGALGDGSEQPDLVAVTGLDQEGRQIDGYALWVEIQGPAPSTPEEARRRRAEDRARFPNGKEVAIYKSDGETRIGTFTVGVG